MGTKNWNYCAGGLMMGTIKKVPIGRVIKDDDQVFLGHQISAMDHSMNIRELIAKRALACAERPLLFDYNQKDNCEAFANLMTGAADPEEGKLGAQEDNTP